MFSVTFKSRFCAVILIISLLTLKASLILTSYQQTSCDLSPRKAISVVGAINETNEGTMLRLGREREQPKLPGVFFLLGSSRIETLFGRELLATLLPYSIVLFAKNFVLEEDISSIPHPNTVSRK